MKVKVESDRHGFGKVFVDGEELKDVISINVSLGVGDLNRVTIELLSDQVDVDLKEAYQDEGVKTL